MRLQGQSKRISKRTSSKSGRSKTAAKKSGIQNFANRERAITSRIRSIGNSKGVILNNKLIGAAGLNTEADIVIRASEGMITILQAKQPAVNTDLSTWDAAFKAAINIGKGPEEDLFEGLANDFDNQW